jgi:hypothetical protein
LALAELAAKGPDADLLREMIQHVAQRMMEMDVEGRCGAAFGERSPERSNSRNGYRERAFPFKSTTNCVQCRKRATGNAGNPPRPMLESCHPECNGPPGATSAEPGHERPSASAGCSA